MPFFQRQSSMDRPFFHKTAREQNNLSLRLNGNRSFNSIDDFHRNDTHQTSCSSWPHSKETRDEYKDSQFPRRGKFFSRSNEVSYRTRYTLPPQEDSETRPGWRSSHERERPYMQHHEEKFSIRSGVTRNRSLSGWREGSHGEDASWRSFNETDNSHRPRRCGERGSLPRSDGPGCTKEVFREDFRERSQEYDSLRPSNFKRESFDSEPVVRYSNFRFRGSGFKWGWKRKPWSQPSRSTFGTLRAPTSRVYSQRCRPLSSPKDKSPSRRSRSPERFHASSSKTVAQSSPRKSSTTFSPSRSTVSRHSADKSVSTSLPAPIPTETKLDTENKSHSPGKGLISKKKIPLSRKSSTKTNIIRNIRKLRAGSRVKSSSILRKSKEAIGDSDSVAAGKSTECKNSNLEGTATTSQPPAVFQDTDGDLQPQGLSSTPEGEDNFTVTSEEPDNKSVMLTPSAVANSTESSITSEVLKLEPLQLLKVVDSVPADNCKSVKQEKLNREYRKFEEMMSVYKDCGDSEEEGQTDTPDRNNEINDEGKEINEKVIERAQNIDNKSTSQVQEEIRMHRNDCNEAGKRHKGNSDVDRNKEEEAATKLPLNVLTMEKNEDQNHHQGSERGVNMEGKNNKAKKQGNLGEAEQAESNDESGRDTETYSNVEIDRRTRSNTVTCSKIHKGEGHSERYKERLGMERTRHEMHRKTDYDEEDRKTSKNEVCSKRTEKEVESERMKEDDIMTAGTERNESTEDKQKSNTNDGHTHDVRHYPLHSLPHKDGSKKFDEKHENSVLISRPEETVLRASKNTSIDSEKSTQKEPLRRESKSPAGMTRTGIEPRRNISKLPATVRRQTPPPPAFNASHSTSEHEQNFVAGRDLTEIPNILEFDKSTEMWSDIEKHRNQGMIIGVSIQCLTQNDLSSLLPLCANVAMDMEVYMRSSYIDHRIKKNGALFLSLGHPLDLREITSVLMQGQLESVYIILGFKRLDICPPVDIVVHLNLRFGNPDKARWRQGEMIENGVTHEVGLTDIPGGVPLTTLLSLFPKAFICFSSSERVDYSFQLDEFTPTIDVTEEGCEVRVCFSGYEGMEQFPKLYHRIFINNQRARIAYRGQFRYTFISMPPQNDVSLCLPSGLQFGERDKVMGSPFLRLKYPPVSSTRLLEEIRLKTGREKQFRRDSLDYHGCGGPTREISRNHWYQKEEFHTDVSKSSTSKLDFEQNRDDILQDERAALKNKYVKPMTKSDFSSQTAQANLANDLEMKQDIGMNMLTKSGTRNYDQSSVMSKSASVHNTAGNIGTSETNINAHLPVGTSNININACLAGQDHCASRTSLDSNAACQTEDENSREENVITNKDKQNTVSDHEVHNESGSYMDISSDNDEFEFTSKSEEKDIRRSKNVQKDKVSEVKEFGGISAKDVVSSNSDTKPELSSKTCGSVMQYAANQVRFSNVDNTTKGEKRKDSSSTCGNNNTPITNVEYQDKCILAPEKESCCKQEHETNDNTVNLSVRQEKSVLKEYQQRKDAGHLKHEGGSIPTSNNNKAYKAKNILTTHQGILDKPSGKLGSEKHSEGDYENRDILKGENEKEATGSRYVQGRQNTSSLTSDVCQENGCCFVQDGKKEKWQKKAVSAGNDTGKPGEETPLDKNKTTCTQTVQKEENVKQVCDVNKNWHVYSEALEKKLNDNPSNNDNPSINVSSNMDRNQNQWNALKEEGEMSKNVSSEIRNDTNNVLKDVSGQRKEEIHEQSLEGKQPEDKNVPMDCDKEKFRPTVRSEDIMDKTKTLPGQPAQTQTFGGGDALTSYMHLSSKVKTENFRKRKLEFTVHSPVKYPKITGSSMSKTPISKSSLSPLSPKIETVGMREDTKSKCSTKNSYRTVGNIIYFDHVKNESKLIPIDTKQPAQNASLKADVKGKRALKTESLSSPVSESSTLLLKQRSASDSGPHYPISTHISPCHRQDIKRFHPSFLPANFPSGGFHAGSSSYNTMSGTSGHVSSTSDHMRSAEEQVGHSSDDTPIHFKCNISSPDKLDMTSNQQWSQSGSGTYQPGMSTEWPCPTVEEPNMSQLKELKQAFVAYNSNSSSDSDDLGSCDEDMDPKERLKKHLSSLKSLKRVKKSSKSPKESRFQNKIMRALARNYGLSDTAPLPPSLLDSFGPKNQ